MCMYLNKMTLILKKYFVKGGDKHYFKPDLEDHRINLMRSYSVYKTSTLIVNVPIINSVSKLSTNDQ